MPILLLASYQSSFQEWFLTNRNQQSFRFSPLPVCLPSRRSAAILHVHSITFLDYCKLKLPPGLLGLQFQFFLRNSGTPNTHIVVGMCGDSSVG